MIFFWCSFILGWAFCEFVYRQSWYRHYNSIWYMIKVYGMVLLTFPMSLYYMWKEYNRDYPRE